MATTVNKSRRKKRPHPSGESWMNRYWRPIAAITYIIICLFDFLVAPIIFSSYSFHLKSEMLQAWTPLTLQGGGIFHISFGAILSVSAWTRGSEKVAMINNQSYPYQQTPYGFNTGSTGGYHNEYDTNPLPPIRKPIKRL